MKGDSLVNAARKSIIESADTLSEGVDLLVSAATESDVLGNIPLVSTGVKLLKARDTFRQHVYVRNCYALLEACRSADRDLREKLWHRLAQDHDKTEDFVDTLLLITSESSKPIKAQVVGKLIAALATESITYEQYDALVHVVHSASIPALKSLPSFIDRIDGYGTSSHTVPEEPLLLSSGLAFRFGNGFRVGELGQLLYVHGFGGETREVTMRANV